MRLALTFIKSEYENNDTVAIKAVEVVDSTRNSTEASAAVEFTDTVNNITYTKRCVDAPETNVKKTILSNYDDPVTGGCVYKKSTNEIMVMYTNPNNRNIQVFDKKYPLVVDQFLGTIVN